jgi:hypothetical protein
MDQFSNLSVFRAFSGAIGAIKAPNRWQIRLGWAMKIRDFFYANFLRPMPPEKAVLARDPRLAALEFPPCVYEPVAILWMNSIGPSRNLPRIVLANA